ncbi:UDP-glucose 4-epimerase GalE [Lederbergia sp. NSJ-179]|uniref:UDP-glucose 4-epimerase GalE n=1 Tax=Lederbergia sp. NSJ-179 TaxID=2931402 RepID=UPI001FD34980|nr:UDP-glucose 4-epimerase GalE [Lederbergia sp. NSJ-179]MCJ7840965.1 UDP-glucose 4-epimerase GalE [Lederbergia sp. NSJ-179]
MAILVTGGAGYIGCHTCLELLDAGYDVIVIDNFSNSHPESLRRVMEITGKKLTVYSLDLLDKKSLETVFQQNQIEAVIHFAGLKAVGESVLFPLSYYQTNILSTVNLCEMMKRYDVKHFVFSSSATVYGIPEQVPICEKASLRANNPYGRTKRMIEEILRDLFQSDPNWSIALLRYFNPIGAHESGKIGENPKEIPNNLMPYITQVAIGKLQVLSIYGNDYPTRDGTGIRDYIHVVDLAKGHVKALEKMMTTTGVETYNLGTGKGYSVLELVAAFEKVSGLKIPYKIVERRPGDIAASFADVSKAKRELGWVASKGIEEMCRDAWKWQTQNPYGYESRKEQ